MEYAIRSDGVIDWRAEGNARRLECVKVILNTIRGEIPYARDMGIDGTIIDGPVTKVQSTLAADLAAQLLAHAPGVKLKQVRIAPDGVGDYIVEAVITID